MSMERAETTGDDPAGLSSSLISYFPFGKSDRSSTTDLAAIPATGGVSRQAMLIGAARFARPIDSTILRSACSVIRVIVSATGSALSAFARP
jgi:hypothetical protein